MNRILGTRFRRQAAVITEKHLAAYRQALIRAEKSRATVEKYLRDAALFCAYTARRPLTKELVVAYKQSLLSQKYAMRTVNAKLCAVNGLLAFLGRGELRVKGVRRQRQLFCSRQQALTKAEYLRLLHAAGDRPWLSLLLQTICGTGIRMSELRFFTAEAVQAGAVRIACKGKVRVVPLPGKLRRQLLAYCRRERIRRGVVFHTRGGKPLDRSFILAQMKRLALRARVAPGKCFPHNLRKLFAVTFYRAEKDIARLADVLGHSSISTTRIYIATTEEEVRRQIDALGLAKEMASTEYRFC